MIVKCRNYLTSLTSLGEPGLTDGWDDGELGTVDGDCCWWVGEAGSMSANVLIV